ncbi:DHA2 family efflux MFS transporter permease subunit [Tuberibacillus sp. Marseille-P3662]|uniref:DHA2 family efflux MFS transporter permease subunit n=1 Tax=Tuberibacillus sp. Marseille-P3662 TaxID=1965358 RepID=UPI000A1C94DB|nr:DHA2 family efflux MFS transporter permease subunit [Tuberibacillus sp. Marseille-P3662]
MSEEVENQQNVKKGPIMVIMLSGAFIAILNETLLNTALPIIKDTYGIEYNTVQWLTTAFLLTNGVMIPISAFLIEKFSTRKLFLTAMSVFAIGTLVAAVSNTFPVLLTARVIQAAGSGIMLPLMMNVFLAIFPSDKRGAAMGSAGMVIAFAPAIGPTLSGWLIEHYSWRLLFYVVLPIAIIDIIAASFALKNVTKLTNPKIDILSIILSSIGFGGLLYGFSKAGKSGWGETEVLVTLIVGAIVLAVFIWRQLKMKHPMLEFRVLKYNTFTLAMVITMIVMMALLGAETLLPMYMQNMRGFTALESGLMLLPGAIVMGLMSPITGVLFDKIGAKILATSGLAIVAVMTFFFTDLTPSTSFTFLIIVYAIRMFGLALAMMPVMTAGLNQLPEKMHPHGTAVVNTMQQVAGSIGTAVLITFMTNSAESRREELTIPKGTSPAEAKEMMANTMIHGMNVAFMIAAGLAAAGVILAFFIKTPKKTGDGETITSEGNA